MIIEGEQRTDEWRQIRTGKITASQIPDLMAKVKMGVAAGRRKLEATRACEIMTGVPMPEGRITGPMQWGIDQEPEAVSAYEAGVSVLVHTCMFAAHPDYERSGASPDGLVGEDGMIEVKCPEPHTHMDYILIGKVPRKYQPQMQWGMACAEREWCDFISYDPRMPVNCRLFVARLMRDDEYIALVNAQIESATANIDMLVTKLSEWEL